MVKVHCQGCGRTEPADQQKRKIKKVSLTIMGDRSWDNGTEYTEDLCPDCVESIVKTYFGVKEIGSMPSIVLHAAEA